MIYTLGYKNYSFYEFKDLVIELDVMIVDIRFSPYTSLPFWGKAALSEYFRDKYIHIKELGNINYNNCEEIKIKDISQGSIEIEKIFLVRDNILLLCACKDIEKCHRKLVAEILGTKNKEEIKHF